MTVLATVIRPAIVTTLALSYDEIARRLGITTASARRLVHRRRWPKSRGNDHRAVIQVPADFFERRSDSLRDSPDDAPSDSHTDSHTDSPSGAPSGAPIVSDLLARLATAQAELI